MLSCSLLAFHFICKNFQIYVLICVPGFEDVEILKYKISNTHKFTLHFLKESMLKVLYFTSLNIVVISGWWLFRAMPGWKVLRWWGRTLSQLWSWFLPAKWGKLQVSALRSRQNHSHFWGCISRGIDSSLKLAVD